MHRNRGREGGRSKGEVVATAFAVAILRHRVPRAERGARLDGAPSRARAAHFSHFAEQVDRNTIRSKRTVRQILSLISAFRSLPKGQTPSPRLRRRLPPGEAYA